MPLLPSDSERSIIAGRLELRPQRADHAAEMWALLNDRDLHTFTGDDPPPSERWLRRRYEALESRRSSDGSEVWLNWVIMLRPDGPAIGFVQASLRDGVADLAWVVGVQWQRQGYAVEASAAMTAWLRQRYAGVRFRASIHPGHSASNAVAARLGLVSTAEFADGEVLWTS